MALEGNLREFQVAEILQMISRQGKTGILTIQAEHDIIAISFLRGQVVAADALNQSVEEGLGEVLVQQRLVREEDFAGLAGEHQAGGGRVIDLLVERGYLDRAQLMEGLRLQVFRLLERVLGWREGDFKFYAGEEVSYEEGFLPLAVEEILVRAWREHPEILTGTVPGPDDPFQRHEGAAAGVAGDWALAGETLEESEILQRLEQPRSARALQRETGLSEHKIVFALYRLERAGLVRPQRAGVDRRARPAAAPAAAVVPAPDLGRGRAAAPRGAADAAASRPAPPAAVEAPRPPEPGVHPWLARGFAAGFAVLLVLTLALRPASLLFPIPGQGAEREEFEKTRRQALYLKIDRAAKTFFLLEGRFPDALARLAERRLLAERDLGDPQGRSLAYAADEASYLLQPVREGEVVAGIGHNEGIAGNFLLDPEFIVLTEPPTRPPIVLLD